MIPTAIVTLRSAIRSPDNIGTQDGLNVYSTSMIFSIMNSGLYNIVDSIEKRIVVQIVSKQAYRHVNSLLTTIDL